MAERGSDIEFDFFDEPETQEAPARSATARARPRRPGRPPTGFTPLLRLVGLISFAIALIVVLVFVVERCRSEGERETYRDYMGDVREVARDSERLGRNLTALLATAGLKQADLEQRLGGLAAQQEQGVTRIRNRTPPGTLRPEHQNAIEALQFRASGLRRLQDAFRQTARSRDADAAGNLLAAQAQRLLVSDIIWDDLFKEPSIDELRARDIGGVEVPDSNFLASPDFATARSLKPIWQRIRGAATGGTPTGKHGNGVVSVRVLPGGEQLDTSDNFVLASPDLAFEVTVENSGDFQEVRVGVRLTVQQAPDPIRKRAVINFINPGERKKVVFSDLGQIVRFAQKTTVRVTVEKVRGETFLDNNNAAYPVTFSLTPP